MEEKRRLVLVAACALIDASGRILLARRPPGKSMASLWEFPGGKVEPGERPEAALARELKEELGIELDESELSPFTFASHRYELFDLLMPLYICRVWRGRAEGLEGQEIAWVSPSDLGDFEMPPADEPLCVALENGLLATRLGGS